MGRNQGIGSVKRGTNYLKGGRRATPKQKKRFRKKRNVAIKRGFFG